VRRRLSRTPRWLALDPEGDYDDLPGVTTCRAFAGGHGEPGPYVVDQVKRFAREEEVRLSLVTDRPADHLAAADALFKVMDLKPEARTVALVVEEAWKLLEGQKLPPEFRRVYYSGNKRGVWAVTVTQDLAQVPKNVRRASKERIFFRVLGGVPDDVAKQMTDEALEKMPTLEVLERDGPEAVKGTHFVTYPADLDPLEGWERAIRGSGG
jgi:hypothetical protein